MNTIVDHIKESISLSEIELLALSKIVTKRAILKKEYLLVPPAICYHQTYISSGALRSYYINESGEEHTVSFAVEDWFISDFNSYIMQTPAVLHIQAIEDSVVEQVQYDAIESLCESHPIFEKHFRKVAQKSFAYSQKRILSKLESNAEKRFLEYQSLYPSIASRVPQYMLASYLGMSAEFLSKIKKRLDKK